MFVPINRSCFSTLIVFGILILLTPLLSGCVPVDFEKMVPEKMSLKKKHKSTVHVLTEGGTEPSFATGAQITNTGLKLAIINSINEYGLFSSVATIGDADYVITVKLLASELQGSEFRMSTYWILSDEHQNKTWDNFIVSTAETIDSAARESIRQGLEEISNLKLDGKN